MRDPTRENPKIEMLFHVCGTCTLHGADERASASLVCGVTWDCARAPRGSHICVPEKWYVRGAAQSIAMRENSRPRSALRIQTPPLQRRTHRTPGCAPLKRRRHSPARSTCADAFGVRSSPLGADMVGKSRNMSADMLFTPGLLALMPPTICCVRSQSVRDLVTEISGGATPAPVRCGSEL